MFELLDESLPPSLELWQLYWRESAFMQFMLGAHYLLTRVLPYTKVSNCVLRRAVQYVPFPFMPYFFRKNGQNVLLNNDRFWGAVRGNFVANSDNLFQVLIPLLSILRCFQVSTARS